MQSPDNVDTGRARGTATRFDLETGPFTSGRRGRG